MDLINREDVKAKRIYSHLWHEYVVREKDIDKIQSVETAIKRGYWINTGSGEECSECHEIQYGVDNGRFYCQNCGAKMTDKEVSESA